MRPGHACAESRAMPLTAKDMPPAGLSAPASAGKLGEAAV
jgi:hypothetical protein